MSFRVSVGRDEREPQAHEVAKFSRTRRPSIPVSVAPIRADDLRARRGQDPRASIEFHPFAFPGRAPEASRRYQTALARLRLGIGSTTKINIAGRGSPRLQVRRKTSEQPWSELMSSPEEIAGSLRLI